VGRNQNHDRGSLEDLLTLDPITPVRLDGGAWELAVHNNHIPVNTVRGQSHASDVEVVLPHNSRQRRLLVRIRAIRSETTCCSVVSRGEPGRHFGISD